MPFSFWPRKPKLDPALLRPQITAALFPPAMAHCAVVVDLPGGESILCGALLATLGYQPVPVMTSCALPQAQQGLYPTAVDADAIITALVVSARTVETAPPNGPPAFLIDAKRQAPGVYLDDNFFDNRSAIFTSDFPSAARLREHGITRVLIFRDPAYPALPDLGYALNPWRLGGLSIETMDTAGHRAEVEWPPDTWLGRMLHRLKIFFCFRSNFMGGYGRFVSNSSGG